jgi:hypothetical protein
MTTDDPTRTKGTITMSVEFVRDRFSIKSTQWRTHLGPITGLGRTITDAKADLQRRLRQALDRLDTDPAFARDDDGSLIVAVQQSHGVVHWRITPDGTVRSITATSGPPRRSLEGTWHYTILGD